MTAAPAGDPVTAVVEPQPRPGGGSKIKTLGWSGVENFSRQILALLFFFVIVRFLRPSDLGIVSLAIAVNATFGIFIDESIGEALVQKAHATREDWDTGFTVNLLIAFGFVLVSVPASLAAARLLHEPELAHAVPALSVAALAGAFGNIHRAFLGRALRFRAIAQTTLVAQVAGGVVGIGLAVAGFGYWAQIGSLAVTAVVMTAIYWAITPWRPRLRIHRASVAGRLSYTVASMTVRSIYLLRDQGPLVIVGLLAGTAEVGFLSLAIRVGGSLSQMFQELTNRPVLSLLSREQHDVAGLGRVLLDILTAVGLLALPAFVGLSEVGTWVIPLVFGPVWAPAGAMLPLVCAALGGWLLLHVVIVSLRARGLVGMAVLITAPAVLLDLLAMGVLARISLEWALLGWAARGALSVPVALAMLWRYLGVPPAALARRWAVPVLGSVLMAVLLRALAGTDALGHGVAGLAALVGVGAAAYGCVVLVGMPDLQRRIRAMVGARR